MEGFIGVPLPSDTNTNDVKGIFISALPITTGPTSFSADESTDVAGKTELSLFVNYLMTTKHF